MSVVKELTQCRLGNHKLLEIANCGGYDVDKVVRWCSICGAIVVDLDVDGRTWKPGGALKMKGPKVLKLV